MSSKKIINTQDLKSYQSCPQVFLFICVMYKEKNVVNTVLNWYTDAYFLYFLTKRMNLLRHIFHEFPFLAKKQHFFPLPAFISLPNSHINYISKENRAVFVPLILSFSSFFMMIIFHCKQWLPTLMKYCKSFILMQILFQVFLNKARCQVDSFS